MNDPVARALAGETFPDGTPLPNSFPPGTIGVIGSDLARYSEFTLSLAGVVATAPPGSSMKYARGVDVSGNCNQIIREMKGEWVWIMGDDHVFDQLALLKLLRHDVDVVVPYVLKRTPPWPPVVYSHQDEDGLYVTATLPEDELTRVHAAGSAGMLIRRRVLDAMEDPWFRPAPDAHGLNEDLYFCRKVREAGFEIYCDPSVAMGHIGVYTVWPGQSEQGWHPDLVFDANHVVPMQWLAQDEQVVAA